MSGNERYIVHVDMDAFFASVEVRDNPSYRGRPVIVGADPRGGKGRGVVSTCSYEARRFGVHSAMPISIAYRRCPQGIFLPVDMERYERESGRIYAILGSFTPEIEAVGIDEAFLDISSTHHLFGGPSNLCALIRARILQEAGLAASVGLAPNKMAAKIASELAKPDGFLEVTDKNLIAFLRPLEVRRIWGLGKKAEERLAGMGVRTIGELADFDTAALVREFGRHGLDLQGLARGIDEDPVEPVRAAKSVSSEMTFDADISEDDAAYSALMELCERVSFRLRRQALKARTITLKIRLTGFETHTRAVTVPESTNFTDILYKSCVELYNEFDRKNRRVRLIGVRASGLVNSGVDESLFRDPASERHGRIDEALDRIVMKFGEGAIYRARAKAVLGNQNEKE